MDPQQEHEQEQEVASTSHGSASSVSASLGAAVSSSLKFIVLLLLGTLCCVWLLNTVSPSKPFDRSSSSAGDSDSDTTTTPVITAEAPEEQGKDPSSSTTTTTSSKFSDGRKVSGKYVVFPTNPKLQVSTNEIVRKRNTDISSSSFPCIAASSSRPAYDFLFVPIGCFGDLVAHGQQQCASTSCRLGRMLAQVAADADTNSQQQLPQDDDKSSGSYSGRCAKKKFGAFIGDNFYPWGIMKRKEARFEYELNAKFWRHPSLRMKYYSTVGNHDLPKPHYQLRADHPYWVMPAYAHVSPLFQVASSKSTASTVQLFLIDSKVTTEAQMRSQGAWLDSALTNASSSSTTTTSWRIVSTHEPIWCFMGFEHNANMMKHIHPVLVKHQIDLFVAAHVHSVSLHKCPGGYHHLVSAGFSDNVHDIVKPKRPPGFYHLGTGATFVLFNSTHMDIGAVSDEGKEIFSASIRRRSRNKRKGEEQDDENDGGENGKEDEMKQGYWKWQKQCDTLLPLVPPYCQKKT